MKTKMQLLTINYKVSACKPHKKLKNVSWGVSTDHTYLIIKKHKSLWHSVINKKEQKHGQENMCNNHMKLESKTPNHWISQCQSHQLLKTL